jgi:hypothetical protein
MNVLIASDDTHLIFVQASKAPYYAKTIIHMRSSIQQCTASMALDRKLQMQLVGAELP